MPKYKVSSSVLKHVFESDKELTFDQAVAYALDEAQPKTLGSLICVKFYGETPGKRINSVDNDHYALTEGVLRNLGRWKVEPPRETPEQIKEAGMITLLEGAGTVAIGEFVRRQTPESQYSHYEGTDEDLLRLIHDNWYRHTPGYRDGVVLVPVYEEGFFSSVIKVTSETPLEVDFKARCEGEQEHIGVIARGDKTNAKFVEIVLYRSDVLEEGNERTTEADWEVISINASPCSHNSDTHKEIPMRPLTMARNFLVKKGGTKGEYTAEQFAESIWFWSIYATAIPMKYYRIIGGYTKEPIGWCAEDEMEHAANEDPGVTFEQISKAEFDADHE